MGIEWTEKIVGTMRIFKIAPKVGLIVLMRPPIAQ